jgi:hypothetical protein
MVLNGHIRAQQRCILPLRDLSTLRTFPGFRNWRQRENSVSPAGCAPSTSVSEALFAHDAKLLR